MLKFILLSVCFIVCFINGAVYERVYSLDRLDTLSSSTKELRINIEYLNFLNNVKYRL